MHPYRLEMTSRPFPREDEDDANLASRWRRRVSIYLGKELTRIRSPPRLGEEGEEGEGGPILVNLASEEYSSCIDANLLPRNAIFLNVVFLHAGRVISVHAKRARGCMARYLAEVGARTLRDVCDFDREGYRCVAFADGNMWKEDAGKKCDSDAKIMRVIFDRDVAKWDAKRSASDSKKQNASKKTKKL
ncbi:hypothetical protein ACHAW5_006894 [Stephanodiscus triporus]|uniref:Uncharacterized protein n=1 Tax=Stephanodiscus triporus TaxID=2934178 RepID=A0ABD3PAX6_9STRA